MGYGNPLLQLRKLRLTAVMAKTAFEPLSKAQPAPSLTDKPDGKNKAKFPACGGQGAFKGLLPNTHPKASHTAGLVPTAVTCQACLLEPPSWAELRGRLHKGPFVPVARARLYLFSLGKQEVPGAPLCYDNFKSIFFPS